MKYVSFFLSAKKKVFDVPTLFFLVCHSCEQQESSLTPILGALPNGQLVQDCSVTIRLRNC